MPPGGYCKIHWQCSFPFFEQTLIFQVMLLSLQPVGLGLPFPYSTCYLRYSLYPTCSATPPLSPLHAVSLFCLCAPTALFEMHITAFITLWYDCWFLRMSPPIEWELPEDSTHSFSTHKSQHSAWNVVKLHRWY